MAADEYGEKTEQPTDRRRSQAREKGNVARSIDLNAAGVMLAAASALLFFGPLCAETLAGLVHATLADDAWLTFDRGLLLEHAWQISGGLLRGVLPMMLVAALTSLAVNLAQVGFLWAPEVLLPKLERLHPVEGAKRILSIRALAKLGASLGKLILLIVIAATYIHWRLPDFVALASLETGPIAVELGRSLVTLAFLLALALLVLALADFAFQRWKHEQDLRMTKQEVRDELKEMEGDPHVRQRRRDVHRKLALARELKEVQHADVVITNPTQIAVALKYDPQTMPAPTVVAKGMGELAARIRQIAEEHGIPLIERKPLARALYRDVATGRAIPVEMYEVFVEIMAYVYRISGKTPKLEG